MNKRDYRQIGTLDFKKSMGNLVKDLENVNRTFLLKEYKNKNFRNLSQKEIQLQQDKPNVLKKQASQVCTTGKPLGTSNKQNVSTDRNDPPLKEHISSNQCFINKISMPKSTAVTKTKNCQTNVATTSRTNEYFSDRNTTSQNVIVNLIKESFKNLNQRLDIIEQKENENHSMLMCLYKARNRKVKDVPTSLPFTSIENFLQFNDVNDEVYNEVVDYFIYLGGLNTIDCAATYFKHAFENNEKVSLEMTWHGTKCLTALKVTRFAQACEDAMSSNMNFPKPRRNEFEDSMIKALKSTKERFRRHQKQSKDLRNNRTGEITAEAETIEEPVTKKSKNGYPTERKRNTQFHNSGNIESQVKMDEIQNYQIYINENNLSDIEPLKQDPLLHSEKQEYDLLVRFEDLSDSNDKYEDSNNNISNDEH